VIGCNGLRPKQFAANNSALVALGVIHQSDRTSPMLAGVALSSSSPSSEYMVNNHCAASLCSHSRNTVSNLVNPSFVRHATLSVGLGLVAAQSRDDNLH
jgi:hypothetical protein